MNVKQRAPGFPGALCFTSLDIYIATMKQSSDISPELAHETA